jgi:hypothetical protein
MLEGRSASQPGLSGDTRHLKFPGSHDAHSDADINVRKPGRDVSGARRRTEDASRAKQHGCADGHVSVDAVRVGRRRHHGDSHG